MHLIITSPDSELLDVTQVDWVNIRLVDGSPISIYANHAPLVALHAACEIKYRIDNQVFEKQISEGVLSIADNEIKCWVNNSPQASASKINKKEMNKE